MRDRDRLVVLKGKYDDSLFKDYDREQVEKKYGGDVPDVTQFWPPVAFRHHLMKKGIKKLRATKKLNFFKVADFEVFKSVIASKSMNYSMMPTLNVSDPLGNTKILAKSTDLNIKKSTLRSRPNYKSNYNSINHQLVKKIKYDFLLQEIKMYRRISLIWVKAGHYYLVIN